MTTPEQALRLALDALLQRYVALVNSGDAGNWDCEAEPVVIAARAALSAHPAPAGAPQAASVPDGWRPIATEFPPPDSWLLVTWGSHKAVDKAHTFMKWKHPSNPSGYLIQGHPGSHNDVTHWQFLPKEPA